MDHIDFTTPYRPVPSTDVPPLFNHSPSDGDQKKTSIVLNSYMDVITFLMFVRDTAQLLHWATYKFSTHIAMGEFYDGLEDLIDDMAEMMMGSEETMDFSTADTVSHQLPKEPCEFMAAVRTTMIDAGHLFDHEPALKNKYDEIIGLINKTKYKIDRLVS